MPRLDNTHHIQGFSGSSARENRTSNISNHFISSYIDFSDWEYVLLGLNRSLIDIPSSPSVGLLPELDEMLVVLAAAEKSKNSFMDAKSVVDDLEVEF